MSEYGVTTIATISKELKVDITAFLFNGERVLSDDEINHEITMTEKLVNSKTKQKWTSSAPDNVSYVVIKHAALKIKNQLIEKGMMNGTIVDDELYFKIYLEEHIADETKEGEIVKYYGVEDYDFSG